MASDARRRYFAYGANIIAADMARRCPAAREIGTTILPGWRFVVTRGGYSTMVPGPSARVVGVLWSLTPACEQTLDEFEEIDAGLFRPDSIVVGDEPALVYLATDTEPGRARAGYLESVIAAAEARGFPADYIKEIRGWLSRA
ncbi:MAG TPA: gamma-glutamylcyclotransferase family protein [Stellaceae bacterium]|nr:gamma-glutamylcyclotransferase family protein [Stellaceae bacterium]